ncbi:hypothetical protein R0137_05205 [Congregibacter brevis]|uniref:Replication-associated protein ORF2/G2P domain-containing protein n=1 Tax=Congregibacter brevis TaxID=3081201 RepID=A0ABZ0IGZ9_9GAMM|nr:hypothetical protein R0137_05205 [Congregibacter sp. IMCC45268]
MALPQPNHSHTSSSLRGIDSTHLLAIMGGMNTPTPESLLADFRKNPRYLRRIAYGDLISRWPWEWFVTLTFAEDLNPDAAMKKVRVWLSRLAASLYGRRWYKNGALYWICAEEYQKQGRIHFHLVIAGVRNTRRLTWMDKWQFLDRKTGFARIEAVESNSGSSHYLAKYLGKDGEIYFSHNLKDISSDLVAQSQDQG